MHLVQLALTLYPQQTQLDLNRFCFQCGDKLLGKFPGTARVLKNLDRFFQWQSLTCHHKPPFLCLL